MFRSLLATAVLAGSFGTVMASSHLHAHEHMHAKRQETNLFGTPQGCYSSVGSGFTNNGAYTFQSTQYCAGACTSTGNVFALSATNTCSCGTLMPPASAKVDSSLCNAPCVGYPDNICGSSSGAYFSLYSIPGSTFGTQAAAVANSGGSSSAVSSAASSVASSAASSATSATTPSSTSTSTPTTTATTAPASSTTQTVTSIVTQPTTSQTTAAAAASTVAATTINAGKTIVSTVSNSNTATASISADSSSSSTNHTGTTVGIAVGVVVGVVVLIALIAGAILYVRRRRRAKNAENSHRRADSLNAFVASGAVLPGSNIGARSTSDLTGTLPSFARSISSNDSRLDPRIMVENNRDSMASVFADNQDYSRRILKVANPDGL